MDSGRLSIGSGVSIKRQKSINDLPADVLLIIFRDVLRAARPPTVRSPGVLSEYPLQLDPWPVPLSQRTRRGEKIDVEHPAPECLATVCPYWREVMSSMSGVWKSFVIWTGRNSTPPSRVRQYFAWSGTHPFDVFVFRRYDPSVHDPSEKAHIRAIVELLIPHIKRIRVLCVHCIYASSLPRPCVDLLGQADILCTLILESVIDDLVVDTDSSPPLCDLDTPMLQHLSIKGVHFRESYFLAPSPLWQLQSLTISDYGTHNVVFPLVEIIEWINRHNPLRTLTLDNLHLDYAYNGPPMSGCSSSDYVHFVNMSGNVIAEYARLFDYPYLKFMTCTACTAPTGVYAKSGLLRADCLTLDCFTDEDALLAYLAGNVGALSCRTLRISKCVALTPRVLRELAGPATGDPRTAWICPNVIFLRIEDCPQMQSADLRAVIQARLEAHAAVKFVDPDHPRWTITALEDLFVQRCCKLVAEDWEWFSQHGYSMYWDRWLTARTS